MGAFLDRLRAAARDPSGRRWRFVPYDQLSLELGGLDRVDPRSVGLVFVESAHKAGRRPYHRQKLALVLANQRHFACEVAEAGFAVRYLTTELSYADALRPVARELGGLDVLEPAERELRHELAPLVADGLLRVLSHDGWLTTAEDLRVACPRTPYRMDTFYRHVRRRTGVLMDGDAPLGGKFSFDTENRQPWRGDPPAPSAPRFRPDAITHEVGELVRTRFATHPGRLDLDHLPATAADADALWTWALRECLPWFGPYEDALSSASRGLFHTRVSPLLNLQRVLPSRVVGDVAAASHLPLPSREGFVRQVLGWREFVHHVHVVTDGFRSLAPAVGEVPGDGGWGRAYGSTWPSTGGDPGAAPSQLGAVHDVPPALWGKVSGLQCLDDVVASVWDEGWSHHITRLMVIGNIATLLGVSPRALTDWFWVAYIDAYDWVVEPNVLAMATFGTDVMTTKPYVSGAAYLSKMGAPCRSCRFDPKSSCPLTPAYWAFLHDHADTLAGNHRMAVPVAAARKRDAARRAEDLRVRDALREALLAGERVTPGSLGT